MLLFLLKVILTPVIIGAVTLIGRKWGPRAAGLVVGLPVTTGPVSAFLATERGPAFALHAASGAVAGLIGTGCFCATYALLARRRGWLTALAGALVALLAVTLLLQRQALSLPALVPLALAALVLLWYGVSAATDGLLAGALRPRQAAPPPAWDLPGRVLVSTGMVAGVTAAAGLLGSRLSGVMSALPVFASVLGAFTQYREGRAAAIWLMRGLIIGCVSAVLFFAVLGALLAPGHLVASYAWAALAAVGSGVVVNKLTALRTRPAGAGAGAERRRAA